MIYVPAAPDLSHAPQSASRVSPHTRICCMRATMYSKPNALAIFTMFRPHNPVVSTIPSSFCHTLNMLRSSPDRSAPARREGGEDRCRRVTHPVHVGPPPRLPPLRDELPESPPPRLSSMLLRDCCPVPRSLMAKRNGSSSSKVLVGRVNLPPR